MKAFIGWLFLCLFMPVVVMAADLETVSIRLERNEMDQSPLPILVQIKTKTSVAENGLRIVVGNGWNLDNNIIVSTSGLPSGLTPLPSISSGVRTTGQIIDFTTGDLEMGVNYGFYISGGIGINPSIGNYLWKVATLNLGAEIDTTTVGVPVIERDQVTVTGVVRALPSDFQLEISANKNGDLSLNELITYEINYGSYLKGLTKPLIISAQWSRGTVMGSPTPSVDIVDYVIGSGSSAWGGVTPVIDLVNRKISWTINSFPGSTINQKVSFQLRVNNSYTGQSRVKFEVEPLLEGAGVTTTDSKIISYFQPSILPTSIPSSAPTSIANSPTAIANIPEPTKVISLIDFFIKKISIVSLSEDKIQIKVESNLAPSELKILYGLSSLNLNKSVTSLNNLIIDFLSIDGLLQNTEYYFKIEAKSGGKSYFSDLYIFKTASSSEGSEIDSRSLIVSVDNNVVLDAQSEASGDNFVVLTPKKNYALRINLKKPELVNMAQVFIRGSQVLGINSVYGAEPNSSAVDLSEIVNGGFIGHLLSPQKEGFYDIVLRLENKNGLIAENKIGTLRVVDNFAVKNKNGKGVENAKVTFYRYLPKEQIYELMSQQSLGIKNPSFTEPDGSLNLSLPKGKYRVEVSAIGYRETQRDFILGLGEDEVQPKIILEKTKMTLGLWWKYYFGTTSDATIFSIKFLDELLISSRFFNLIKIWIMISTILVFGRYFVKKLKISWWLLPASIIFWLKNIFTEREKGNAYGKVVDKDSGLPIADAKVFLLDGILNKIIATTMTDRLGNYKLKAQVSKSYRLMAAKDGYSISSGGDYSPEGLMVGNILIKMENILTTSEKVGIFASKLSDKFIFGLGILWLLALFIFEILFSQKIGVTETWIYLLLSAINIVVWLKNER